MKSKKPVLLMTLIITLTLATEGYSQTGLQVDSNFTPNIAVNATISKPDESIVVPFADVIQWRYKKINGKLYKRQYNTSKKCWIGNWEPI